MTHAPTVPPTRDDDPRAAVQRGLPGVSADEAPLPSEVVLSGELLGERRREAFAGMRRALGERPEGFTREEWAVVVSLLCPPHLPPGTTSARASIAYRARECFPGQSASAALRAYCETRDRPHVQALVADFRALEALDVMAQRGLWRERLDLAGSVAELLRPPIGLTTQQHLLGLGPVEAAKVAAAVAAVTKVAADFDALQAPRTTIALDADGNPATDPASRQADAHKSLAESIERVAEDLRARVSG